MFFSFNKIENSFNRFIILTGLMCCIKIIFQKNIRLNLLIALIKCNFALQNLTNLLFE